MLVKMGAREEEEFLQNIIIEGSNYNAAIDVAAGEEDDGSQYLNMSGDGDDGSNEQ